MSLALHRCALTGLRAQARGTAILAGATTTLLLLAAVAFYTHLDITGPVRVPEWLLKTTAAQLEPTVRTRVGERAFAPFYRGCSSRELIDAVGRSRLRDDAPARYEYRPPNPEDANEIDLRRFSFSTERAYLVATTRTSLTPLRS